jgi:Uma2 family endonuclease
MALLPQPTELYLGFMAVSTPPDSIEVSDVSLRKLTIEEYHKLGDAGILHPNDRIELVDGLLVQMAPIGPEHQFVVEKLNDLFSDQKRGRFKVGPGRPIVIPDFNEPQPDIVLFKTEAETRRQHIFPQQVYLVVEVADTTVKYDSENKLSAYEKGGVPEYWIVDITARTVRVYRLDLDKKYRETRYAEGWFALQAFPDVIVNLQELF